MPPRIHMAAIDDSGRRIVPSVTPPTNQTPSTAQTNQPNQTNQVQHTDDGFEGNSRRLSQRVDQQKRLGGAVAEQDSSAIHGTPDEVLAKIGLTQEDLIK